LFENDPNKKTKPMDINPERLANTKLRGVSTTSSAAKTRLLDAFAAEKKAATQRLLEEKRTLPKRLPSIPQRLTWRYTVLEALEPGTVPISTAPECKSFDNFKVSDSVLGRGGYGVTYRACYDANCREKDAAKYRYAAKIVQLPDNNSRRAFRMEAILCLMAGEHLWGPKIVSVFLCDQDRSGVVVMELLRPLKNEDLRAENLPRLKDFLQRINAMHMAGILHGDLYTKNVMVHPVSKDLRVIDFGLALVTESAVPGSLRASDVVCFLYGMPFPYEEVSPAPPAPAPTAPSLAAQMLQMVVVPLNVLAMVGAGNPPEPAPPRRLNRLLAKPAFSELVVIIDLLWSFYVPVCLQGNNQALIQGAQMRIAESISTADDLKTLTPKGPYSCNVKLYYKLILDAIPPELVTTILTPNGLLTKFPWVSFTLDADMEAATWKMIKQQIMAIMGAAAAAGGSGETTYLESMPRVTGVAGEDPENSTPQYTLLKTLENIPIAASASCARFDDLKISDRILGAGAYGTTFQACWAGAKACTTAADFKYAAKIVKIRNASDELSFRLEGLLAMYAGSKSWGPRVISFFLCQNNTKGVMVMELLRPIQPAEDLQSLETLKRFLDRLNEMHEAGILHGDLYMRNLMVHPETRELMIVDFGFAMPLKGPVPYSLRAADFGSLTYGMPMPWDNSVPAADRLMRLDGGMRQAMGGSLSDSGALYAAYAKYYLRVVLHNNKAAFAEGIRMRVNTKVDLATEATNPPGQPPYNCDVYSYYKTIIQNVTPTLRTDILDPKAMEQKFAYMSFTRDQQTWVRTQEMVKAYLTEGKVPGT